MKNFIDEDTERERTLLVRGIGKRLQRDMPCSEHVPFKMALLIEHLRRAEEHGDRGARVS